VSGEASDGLEPSGSGPLRAGRLPPGSLGGLATESVRDELGLLDTLSSLELARLLAADAQRAVDAAVAAAPALAAAVELVVGRFEAGGRLVYAGAGSAGRIAVLDASELGPTFSVEQGRVEAVIAGGDGALRRSVERAEDDRSAGAAAMAGLGVGAADAVLGVSASGRTPFVLGAVEQARGAGAATIAVTSNAGSELAALAECAVELLVGGEVVAGSSRLNAGTAQKIALNTISTAAMVRLGKTYGNLMVDLRATNIKLRDRALRIVEAVTGAADAEALAALEAAGWNVKLACLLAAGGSDAASAASLLEAGGGRLREALGMLDRSAGTG
jgi:N-acetylmuramic acid 6-phosphate etherase